MMVLSITDWWNDLVTTEQIFWGIAIVFSTLFIIQFGLSIFGLDFDSDVDVDGSDTSYSLDPSFTLLSVRGIIAFFAFFGWTGILALGRGYSNTLVIAMSLLAGLLAMVTVAYLMFLFHRLAERGNADLNDLIFQDGTVYLTIPGHRKGRGKVHVTLNHSLREMAAVTEGEELVTGHIVKIIEIIDNNVLVVEPVEIFESTRT
ncbi:MAG: hypothetical protein HKN87_07925 [Saprospiraceae bacterium]|nr:hypothetical protein [Saprospiraceae bacterium]